MHLHDLFEYHVRCAAERDCAVEHGQRMTYGEVGREVNRLVNALRNAGIQTGDRFAYLSRNSTDMVIAFLAASKSGAVALPLNWRLAPTEWQRIVTQGAARLVIAQAEFAPAFDKARAATLEAFFIIDGKHEGWRDYRQWVAAACDAAQAAQTPAEHALYQMYTSGTTSEPKGVVLTHRSVIANALQGLLAVSPSLGADDRSLIVMPLFHAGATSFAIASLVAGATLVIQREFNAHAMIDALADEVTVVNLVPAMLQMALTQVDDIATRDYSRLHAIIYGASPIAESTLRAALKIFGCRFYQGYGQTESSATLTFLNHADHERALAGQPELLLSAGRPLAGTEIRILAPDGSNLPVGGVGEIVVRGPQLMQGYWQMPDETAATLRGGWLHTGDVGRLDAQGYLYICDRVKDMIISGGENIYPREIENILFTHPAVADAAVIGIPDATYGETVLAVVVCRAGMSVSADELLAHCRKALGGYKLPRRVEFVADLPRNPSGKVLKKELRAPYWQGQARGVH